MKSTVKSVRPQALLPAIAECLRELLGARRLAVAPIAPASGSLSAMQLYRLSRGRDTLNPAVSAMLANRFDAQ